ARRIRGRECAHDEPAVVVIAPPVEQFQLAAFHRLDGQVIKLGLGRHFQRPAMPEHRRLARSTRLVLEYAIVLAELVRPAEQEAGKKLEIEADLAHPLFWNG